MKDLATSPHSYNNILLTELHYLPPIAVFSMALQAKEWHIEAHETYQKQSFRNRCLIPVANGKQTLSIPVTHQTKRAIITEVRIDYDQQWLKDHWRTILSAYGKAPYFDYYIDYFEAIYFSKPATLFELNWKLLELCIQLLDFPLHPVTTLSFEHSTDAVTIDYRSVIHPKRKDFQLNVADYYQLFEDHNDPYTSILDLLFCMGPEAIDILHRSK